ncbi:dihydrofolate reductase [Bremerella cremea]|uniref:dihydrofolate reductase n=1 Tax=Bremerella cremea TaxID=1031537 RepID=UPI0031E6884F
MTRPDNSPAPVILIGAMTPSRVIGIGDGMPWEIPEDYQTFLDNVRGQTVIMGRKSYEIFGTDLTSVHNIVVSRGEPNVNAIVTHSIEEALEKAHSFGMKIFVAGGSEIYELALPLANWIYLSEIKKDYEGDRYFPEFDENEWEIVREIDHAEFIYRERKRRSQ